MDNINEMRWITAPLTAEFSLENENGKGFKLEFEKLSESDDDPLSEWLKLARARGETKESDPVTLALLIELNRKIDDLTRFVKGEKKTRVELKHSAALDGVNYAHFLLADDSLIPNERYYARIAMPIFPIRDVGFYFIAKSARVGEIALMHERDQKAWDSYVASRERSMIRQMKERQ
ncbi:MAG: hypothetical protein LBQ52_05655 [Helicobacteraceae bacterium]|jgi:hypothetical protein|nr:hypothetical protein [Helicobacteraceae bacterium]